MPTLSKYNAPPGNVSQHLQFLDGVEHSARTIPLGTSHLCPPCMTVDGKTYGGAGRGVVCVRWEEGSAKRHATAASPGVTLVAGWHLRSDAVPYTGKGKVLWFLAQREGYTVRMTFTPRHPEATAAPQKTNIVGEKKGKLIIAWNFIVYCFLLFND